MPRKSKALQTAEKRIAALTVALQWCSGSADFGVGGKARRGWLKICRPLLKESE